jgi:hypothetical protein
MSVEPIRGSFELTASRNNVECCIEAGAGPTDGL